MIIFMWWTHRLFEIWTVESEVGEVSCSRDMFTSVTRIPSGVKIRQIAVSKSRLEISRQPIYSIDAHRGW